MTETAVPAANKAASTATSVAAATPQAALDALLYDILPRQGCWSDEAYLWLTDHSRRRAEFTEVRIEELPMPTSTHQAVLLFLYRLFHDYLRPRGGGVIVSGLRMRIREGKFREPDLLMLRERLDPSFQDRYWLGADLVAEVVSSDDPDRDLVEKRADYAEAGIPSIESSIPATRRSPCSRWKGSGTSSTAHTPVAAMPRRGCSTDSPPRWPQCSTPRKRVRDALVVEEGDLHPRVAESGEHIAGVRVEAVRQCRFRCLAGSFLREEKAARNTTMASALLGESISQSQVNDLAEEVLPPITPLSKPPFLPLP